MKFYEHTQTHKRYIIVSTDEESGMVRLKGEHHEFDEPMSSIQSYVENGTYVLKEGEPEAAAAPKIPPAAPTTTPPAPPAGGPPAAPAVPTAPPAPPAAPAAPSAPPAPPAAPSVPPAPPIPGN